MPLAIALMAIGFNGVNAGINGIISSTPTYGAEWLLDPRFIVGLPYSRGMSNPQSDSILRNLRENKRAKSLWRRVPMGQLPQLHGRNHRMAWFRLMTWSIYVLLSYMDNCQSRPQSSGSPQLVPKTFDDYPQNRRALIPGLF